MSGMSKRLIFAKECPAYALALADLAFTISYMIGAPDGLALILTEENVTLSLDGKVTVYGYSFEEAKAIVSILQKAFSEMKQCWVEKFEKFSQLVGNLPTVGCLYSNSHVMLMRKTADESIKYFAYTEAGYNAFLQTLSGFSSKEMVSEVHPQII